MRKSAIGTRISFIIMLLSILILGCTVFISCVEIAQVLQNIGYGILGSSVVSFIIMLAEYFTTKRKTLETYYFSAINTVEQFYKCKYVKITKADSLIAQFKWSYDTYKMLHPNELGGFFTEHEKLINAICEQAFGFIDMPRDDSLVSQLLLIYEKRDDELKTAMKTYCDLIRYKRDQFECDYGDIYYLCAIKKKRKDIFNTIHNPIQKKHNEIKEEGRYFGQYLNGEITNSAIIYDYLQRAICALYEINENENGMIVYSAFPESMMDALEKYRCNIYRKEKYNPRKKRPIYAEGEYIIDFLNSTNEDENMDS